MTVTERRVKDWADYEAAIEEIRRHQYEWPLGSNQFVTAPRDGFLFRGQPDARWKLETTLDRYLPDAITVREYYRYAFRVKHRLETYTARKWDIPNPPEYEKWLATQDAGLFFEDHRIYEYFAFLRHHGFPSPFLDWTASPYIAAFFAMRDVERGAAESSVYVFLERPMGSKVSSAGEATIYTHGPYGNIDERHFLQQSQYTACLCEVDGEPCYVPHEDAMAEEPPTPQDVFWKLDIAAIQQQDFLERLALMNINAFSLFGSLDSLTSALALKEMWLRYGQTKT